MRPLFALVMVLGFVLAQVPKVPQYEYVQLSNTSGAWRWFGLGKYISVSSSQQMAEALKCDKSTTSKPITPDKWLWVDLLNCLGADGWHVVYFEPQTGPPDQVDNPNGLVLLERLKR